MDGRRAWGKSLDVENFGRGAVEVELLKGLV